MDGVREGWVVECDRQPADGWTAAMTAVPGREDAPKLCHPFGHKPRRDGEERQGVIGKGEIEQWG